MVAYKINFCKTEYYENVNTGLEMHLDAATTSSCHVLNTLFYAFSVTHLTL